MKCLCFEFCGESKSYTIKSFVDNNTIILDFNKTNFVIYDFFEYPKFIKLN